MRRRFLGELERNLPGILEAGLLVEVHVSLDLLPLFAQQQRQQVVGSEAAPEPGSETRVLRRARPPYAHAVLAEQLLPHLDVTFLHPGQLDVDILALLVRLLAGQYQVEVGGVGFVLPMVQPGMQRGAVEGHALEDSRNLQDGNRLDGVTELRHGTTSRDNVTVRCSETPFS